MKPGDRVAYTTAWCTSVYADQTTRERRGVFVSRHPRVERWAVVWWDDDDDESVVNAANIRVAGPRGSVGGGRTRARELFLARARDAGQIHGSDLRELFVECGVSSSIWDTDEIVLAELINDGLIKPITYAPTPSQAAFDGLSYGNSYIRQIRETPGAQAGLRTRYLYRYVHGRPS